MRCGLALVLAVILLLSGCDKQDTGTQIAGLQTTAAQAVALTGDECLRVASERTLLENTPVLLIDETVNNLDAGTRDWMRDYIASCDKTVLFISHDGDFLRLADQQVTLGD